MSKQFIKYLNERKEKQILDLLRRKPSLAKIKIYEIPVLMYAVSSNQSLQVIKAILDSGVDVNEVDTSNSTALFYACRYDEKLEVVRLLLERGADPKISNNESPLFYAVQHCSESFQIPQLLIDKGADSLQISISNIPLHYAVKKANDPKIIQLLVDAKSPINQLNDVSLIYIKIQNSILFLSSKLIYFFKKQNETPLFLACAADSKVDIIKVLIENGAKSNSDKGTSLLSILIKKSAPSEVVELIIENFNLNEEFTNSLPYASKFNEGTEFAVACTYSKNPELIKLLLKHGGNPNIKIKIPCVHRACKNSVDIVEVLLEKNVDLELLDQGNTAFFYAATHSIEMIDLLVSKGANINAKNGNNVLHHILSRFPANGELVEKLCSIGVDINEHNNEELTPLILCCKNNQQLPIFEILIKYSARIIDYDIQNLLKYYLEDHSTLNFEIIKLLFSHGGNFKNLENTDQRIFINSKEFEQKQYQIKEIERFFEKYEQIQQDFLDLLDEKDLSDIQIKTLNNEISAHKFILEFRLGIEVEKISEALINYEEENVKAFLEFVYSGNVLDKNYNIILGIAEKMGISIEKINKMILPFWFKEEKFPVHKWVLIARCGLFRGMFLNVKNDSSGEVNDYSQKSFESLNQFIKYLYTDKLDNSISNIIIEELSDASDFYQLNEKSDFEDQLKTIKQGMK
ncbi:ankyrin repeat-containing protein [Anaeramoeba ignava]|uniref:Ankyrin repeat-containing protein n=1 Tax=Anaeramoeba ignava TaxID=1746090 RepID=A0A9Q0RCP0_ANAIG|nr:ankyrin repeat-containing protein [Anaeramoeba ignava]